MKLFKPPRLTNWVFPRLRWRFSISEPVVFITFDDGPNPEITPFVLDLLKQYKWKATFFCVGQNIVKYPELFQRIKMEGHVIGNHTMNHLNSVKTENETYLQSFREFETSFPTKLFRPPYGRIKPSVAKEIGRTHQIIMWSWLSYDYDFKVSNERILSEVKRIKKGEILVLHDNAKITERQKELLPRLFQSVNEMGFRSEAISV
ncbi:polysaccharide deacetylase family protein [Fluviicola chungangensis]|uniref:Polysaccharide deacetylase family protein n=1 Tax=Fluviicola chungangensis TaxID=2597671 RepID=A0A556MPA6_9FLAO|nr:polysaccharide deacetylase family protein [Fluviicola chungangensis]TSJ41662.1 polysaccharide deacetylase family protein [Fluviicola chungangensis]